MKEKCCMVRVGGGRLFFELPESFLSNAGVEKKGFVSFDAFMEELNNYLCSSMVFSNLIPVDDGCGLFLEVVDRK